MNSIDKLIDRYWKVTNVSLAKKTYLVTPDNKIDLIFTDNKIFLSGPMDKSFETSSRPLFGIRLNPERSIGLLKAPLEAFRDQAVTIDDALIDAAEIKNLWLMKSNTQSFERQMNTFFAKKIPTISTQVDKRMIEVVKELKCGRKLSNIAQNFNISSSHLRRLFNRYVGISGKRFEMFERFMRAERLAKQSREKSLLELALDSGYYDQSHFSNECKEITNLAPSKFFLK